MGGWKVAVKRWWVGGWVVLCLAVCCAVLLLAAYHNRNMSFAISLHKVSDCSTKAYWRWCECVKRAPPFPPVMAREVASLGASDAGKRSFKYEIILSTGSRLCGVGGVGRRWWWWWWG